MINLASDRRFKRIHYDKYNINNNWDWYLFTGNDYKELYKKIGRKLPNKNLSGVCIAQKWCFYIWVKRDNDIMTLKKLYHEVGRFNTLG